MSANLKKIELEKNKFIKNLSQEQFDGVVTSKYKKLFTSYFNGTITGDELVSKGESYNELVSIYEDGDNGKIDSNQYLYSAIVDVAIDYYNVANSYETCIEKMNLLASYFQLVASSETELEALEFNISDVFYIYNNLKDSVDYLSSKLNHISFQGNSLKGMLDEIQEYENTIKAYEEVNNTSFIDEVLIDEDIKELYQKHKKTSERIRQKFNNLQKNCVDKKSGAKLDLARGHLK